MRRIRRLMTRKLVPETVQIWVDLDDLMIDLDPGWLDDSWLDGLPSDGAAAAPAMVGDV